MNKVYIALLLIMTICVAEAKENQAAANAGTEEAMRSSFFSRPPLRLTW